ncbi:MAG: DUF5693 family protein [Syntrophomonas sp.]
MKQKFKGILWILLVLTLVLSSSGIYLRVSNENNNKNVVTVADYQEFKKTANAASMNINEIMDRLQEAGVKAIGVKETSLRDLAYEGKVFISPYGEFAAFARTYSPGNWQACQKATGDKIISPDKLVVVSDQPGTIAFLKQRLGTRFSGNEIISFTEGQKTFFIVNTELLPLDKPKDPKKAVNDFVEVDARLGFDEKVLTMLKKRGFEIILRPDNNTGSNLAYLQEYNDLVQKYGVKYLIFGNEVSGAPDNLAPMEEMIKKHHLIIGIIETSEQLKYVAQTGLDEVMKDTGYPINRVYSTTNDEFVNTADERYYRWVRGVIDRGIRILYVSPFKDRKITYSENINNTIEMISRFHKTIEAKGFNINQPLQHLSANSPGAWHRLAVSLSLLLGGVLYLLYLFRPGRRLMTILLALGVLACLAVNILLQADFTKVYALGAAVLYPSFSSLLMLIYLRDHRENPVWKLALAGLAIILGVNAIGMYTVVTSLADIRYIMNVGIFSGVKVAFLLPLLMFVVNYFCCFAGEGGFKEKALESLSMHPTYLVLLLFMVAALALYYYLGRSGNNTAAVSGLEIRLREILESFFLARPRFKEIIIGYPSLFAMTYLYHRYKRDFILFILGFGVVMGSISMVNSFCHVFTAVVISANRTLAGLLVGTICGLAAIAGIYVLEWVYERYVEA